MVKLKYTVRGSTLIETMIAITITVICFTMATVIILNVIRSANRIDRLGAYLVLERLAIESKMNQCYENGTVWYEQMQVEKSFYPSSLSPSALVLEMRATDLSNRILATYKEMILIHGEKNTQN